MNTNKLKTFAQEARNILLPNITQRLRYWGFDEKGNYTSEIIVVQGGYIFRGSVFTDESVPSKLQRLETKVNSAQAFKDIREEAAYTWFNRLMAIKILEENGYEMQILQYMSGTTTPYLLQNAKRGSYDFVEKESQKLLRTYLEESKDEEAFALLLTHYCNTHPMLRTVFGKINDYTEILVPMNLLASNGIVQLINSSDAISKEDYKAVELIGWLYQFYISDRKDEVFANFKKQKKARAEDIPAATQIFTPKWIVQYMVENTLGKLYLDYEPDADDFKDSLQYLVDNPNESEEALIEDIEELRILDPACGSGHILVVAFDLLMKAYDEEGYDGRTAARRILTKHLYGLDIDDRAAQLANFAVRLKAAAYDQSLLTMTEGVSILAFPERRDFEAADVAFLLGDEAKHLTMKVEEALQQLQDGKNLGATIQINWSAAERQDLHNQWHLLSTAYHQQLLSFSDRERYDNLQPFVAILLLLTDRFPAVVANPPYMGNSSMNADLKNYLNKHYPISKSDLFAVFMEAIPNFTKDNGIFAIINLPSWLFLSSFEKLRSSYIKNYTFDSLLHMGRGIFGIDFGSTAFTVRKQKATSKSRGQYFRLHERNFQHIYFEDIEKLFLYSNGNVEYKYDFALYRDESGTNEIPKESIENGKQIFYPQIPQINFAKIPGSPIAYWVSERVVENYINSTNLEEIAKPRQGMATTNNNLFVKQWYEVNIKRIGFNIKSRSQSKESQKKWFPYNKGGETRKWYGIPGNVVNYYNDGNVICNYIDNTPNVRVKSNGRVINRDFYFKEGITWSKVSSRGLAFRFVPEGFVFDVAGTSIFFKSEDEFSYLFPLLNSKVITSLLSAISPTINFEVGQINKIPIITDYSNLDKITSFSDSSIHISKTDWDSRETSWDFKQSPLVATQGEDLAIAYEKWVGQVTADFYQLHANEEELNRIFIEIYGLQDELTPDVPLKDITILQEELDRKALDKLSVGAALPIDRGEVVRQLLSYCIGCAMGRYHLGKTGLHIAHPQATAEETAPYVFTNLAGAEETFEMDEDGILPMMGSDSPFPDDLYKYVTRVIEQIWGSAALTANLNFINAALEEPLETYLANPKKGFWKHHVSMYKKRPIYWLFASSQSRQPAFQVVAYLHRMDKYTAQKIRTRYLHPYQSYLSEQIEKAEADPSFSPREKDKLYQAAIECREYDETLKGLEAKQIALDLDDGVEENYQLFGKAVYKR